MIQLENDYIIGIDFGYRSTYVSYMDLKLLKPRLLDLSGGYGQASIPSIVQYLEPSNEWLIGHEAMLQESMDESYTFDHLQRLLKEKKTFTIGTASLKSEQIVGVFFKQILITIKDINPKANILKIVVTVPQSTYDEVGEALRETFRQIGYSEQQFLVETNTDSVAAYLVQNPEMIQRNVLVADYGYRNLRCSLFNVRANGYKSFEAKVNTFLLDCEISAQTIQNELINQIQQVLDQKYFETNRKQKILKLFYDNKNYLYSKIGGKKQVQIILNNVFPPVAIPIDLDTVETIINDHFKEIIHFMNDLHQYENIEYMITLGMGFEIIKSKYSLDKVLDIEARQNSFTFSEGACYSGYNQLSNLYQISFHNICLVEHDYGVKALVDGVETFIVLFHKGQNWWDKGKEITFIVDYFDNHNVISIFRRSTVEEPLEEVLYVRVPIQNNENKTQQVNISLKFKDYRTFEPVIHEVTSIL